jgi:hypothetical protein
MEEEVVLGTVEDDVCYLTTTSHTSYRWHVHVAFPFLWLYTGVIVRRSQSHLELVDVNDVSVSRKKSFLQRASLCFITVGAFCPVAFVQFFLEHFIKEMKLTISQTSQLSLRFVL